MPIKILSLLFVASLVVGSSQAVHAWSDAPSLPRKSTQTAEVGEGVRVTKDVKFDDEAVVYTSLPFVPSWGDCALYPEQNKIVLNSQPIHGSVRVGVGSYKIPPNELKCAGMVYQVQVVFYKWSDKAKSNGVDQIDFSVFHPHASGKAPEMFHADLNVVSDPEVYFVSPSLMFEQATSPIAVSSIVAKDPSKSAYAAKSIAVDGVSKGLIVVKSKAPIGMTLSVSNSFRLSPYNPNFYENPKLTYSNQLELDGNSFYKMNEYYYSVSFIAPPSGIPSKYSIKSKVLSIQAGKSFLTSVGLAPAPVMFLHGIWGSDESLSHTMDTFLNTQPWSEFPGIVSALSYPNSSAFDSADVKAAVTKEIDAGFLKIKQGGIIASRIDLIAHSMGGLVARAIASGSGYMSLKNYNQGVFRTIITLNTPHTGSELARYLISHRNDVRVRSIAAVWSAKCGRSSKVTVERCFGGMGMSIGDGGVQSLIPGSDNLQSILKLSDVPNLRWIAMGSKVDGGLLKDSLDELIYATYRNNPPTVDGILGTPTNDAIVTLASQFYGASSRVTFEELAHASLQVGILDDNVTESDVVDDTAVCVLRGGKSQSCAPAQQLVKKIRPDNYTVSEGGQISGTFGGILELRFPNRGKVVERVLALQMGLNTGPTRRQTLKYDFDSIGLVAKMVSQRLGTSQINAEVRYSDGSAEFFVFNVESRLDAAQIERVIPFVSDVLSLEVSDDGFPLMPRVDLKSGPKNVPLDGGAKYSISQNGDEAISLVDGRIVAKRPGLAAVKVEVAGKSAELSVEVRAP